MLPLITFSIFMIMIILWVAGNFAEFITIVTFIWIVAWCSALGLRAFSALSTFLFVFSPLIVLATICAWEQLPTLRGFIFARNPLAEVNRSGMPLENDHFSLEKNQDCKQARRDSRQRESFLDFIDAEGNPNASELQLVCSKCGRKNRIEFNFGREAFDFHKTRVCGNCKSQLWPPC